MIDLSQKLTVLILTYNRYDRLARLLKYIHSCCSSFPIFILDSSSDSMDRPSFQPYLERKCIQYFHFDSSISPIQKIAEGLKKISTPYVVIWADDDFMVPKTFEVGVEFLDQNKDFSFVHGQSGLFNSGGEKGAWAVDSFSYYSQRDVLGETAQERLLNHLHQYTCIFYSVYRTDILKRGIKICVDYPFSYNFDEIVPSCIAVIHGKGKKLNRLYMLRERHEEAGISWRESMETARNPDYFDWVTSPVFAQDSNQMIQILAEEIAKIDRISIDEAKRIAKQSFWRFIADRLKIKCPTPCYSESKIRQKLRQIKSLHSLWLYLRSLSWREADRFLLPALKRKSSPYYQDFQSVYRWLENEWDSIK